MAAEQDEAAELDEALWDALRSLNPDAVRRALESGADPDGTRQRTVVGGDMVRIPNIPILYAKQLI